MLGVVRTQIEPQETTGQLEHRLSQLAVPLLFDVIHQIETGTATPMLQDPELVTRVRKLAKPDGRIPWAQSAIEVERHVRGMQPWPGPFTELHQSGKPPLRMQILSVSVVPVDDSSTVKPGGIISGEPHQITVRCGEQGVLVLLLQPDGKRAMSAAEFLNGRKLVSGDYFE